MVLPFLSPLFTYTTRKARTEALQMGEAVKLLMTWMRWCLHGRAQGVNQLEVLYLEDQVTMGRQKIWRELKTANPTAFTQILIYIMYTDTPTPPLTPTPPNLQ